jgi:hypothetical protein
MTAWLMMAAIFRVGQDAHGPWAGAIIAALGGLCAERRVMATVIDLGAIRSGKTMSKLGDAELVANMLMLTTAVEPDIPMFGGQTEVGAQIVREHFAEIMERFIPPHVLEPAFDRFDALMGEGDDG